MTRLQKIKDAIYKHPYLIPELFRSIKKGYVVSQLARAVPYSIGIEFECEGDFMNNFIEDNPDLKLNSVRDICRYFGIMDYSEDKLNCTRTYYISNNIELPTLNNSRFYPAPRPTRSDVDRLNQSEQLVSYGPNTLDIVPEDINTNSSSAYCDENITLNEIRVRIKNYSQLSGLYKILDQMCKYCKVCIGGGIHIHVDFPYSSHIRDLQTKEYIVDHIDQVQDIFPKYEGSYNKKGCGIQSKGYWVNISRYKTLEFRIAPLTFTYETLIKWIIGVSKFTSKLIYDCKYKLVSDSPDPLASKSQLLTYWRSLDLSAITPDEYSSSQIYGYASIQDRHVDDLYHYNSYLNL